MTDLVRSGTERGKPRALDAREIARRNKADAAHPLSPVMKTAATACELAHSPAARKPSKGR